MQAEPERGAVFGDGIVGAAPTGSLIDDVEMPPEFRDIVGVPSSISQAKQFKRAKNTLGIQSVRQGFGPGGGWTWVLPQPAGAPASDTKPRTLVQTRTRCLSAEQAGDTATTFSPEYRTVNSGCERVEFKSTATELRWRMKCTGQMNMDVSGEFTFDTPKHYSAKIVSKGAMGGQELVNTSVSIEAEHIGDCR
jgi:Protein of unknown function (DUF3617)